MASTDGEAWDKVFSLPELFEMIILETRPADLLTKALRINMHWNLTIKHSSRLQRKLFYEPSFNPHREKWQRNYATKRYSMVALDKLTEAEFKFFDERNRRLFRDNRHAWNADSTYEMQTEVVVPSEGNPLLAGDIHDGGGCAYFQASDGSGFDPSKFLGGSWMGMLVSSIQPPKILIDGLYKKCHSTEDCRTTSLDSACDHCDPESAPYYSIFSDFTLGQMYYDTTDEEDFHITPIDWELTSIQIEELVFPTEEERKEAKENAAAVKRAYAEHLVQIEKLREEREMDEEERHRVSCGPSPPVECGKAQARG